MAQSIILKRSALQGKVPTTSSLNVGEIAINTYDGKIYLNRSGSSQSIQEIVTTNVINTGSITLTKTGSFGELVVSQDGNFLRDLYVTRDIIGNGSIDILGAVSASIVSASLFIGNGAGLVNITASMRPDDFDFNSDPFAGTTGYIQGSGSLYKVATTNTAVEFRYNDILRGKFDITNGFSGSIFGIGDVVAFSSSVANLNAFTSSTAGLSSLNSFTASAGIRLTNLESTSASVNSSISNINLFTSSANTKFTTLGNLTGSYATTGSNSFKADQQITGSLGVSGDITVLGSVNARQFNIGIISSSILYTSGSTKFGDTQDDTMSITGSLQVSGSQIVTGSLIVTNGITGSLFGTASFALNGSSNAIMYQTASAASVWTFNHFLATPYPVVTVYDNNNSVIIPQSIVSNDSSSLTITFSSARTGVAVASKGGYVGSAVGTATTANALSTGRLINNTLFDGTQNITIQNLVSGSSQISLAGTSDYSSLFGGIASATASLNTYTGSVSDPKFGILSVVSGALNQFTASINGWSGSIATTGSNTFRGTQQITGSLSVSAAITGSNGKFTTGISAGQLSTPTISTISASSAGGTIPAGTYYYKVAALDYNGTQTPGSSEVSTTVTGSTSNIFLSWSLIQGASSYRVYRSTTSNTYGSYVAVNNGVNGTTFTDTNQAVTSGSIATINDTGYGFFDASKLRTNNITLVNGGIGSVASLTFEKSTDGASINVVEYASDQTMYEFKATDNPDTTTDFFHWYSGDWQNPSSGWKPLKFAGFTNQFIAQNTNFWSSFNLPSNTPYYTTNADTLANAAIKADVYTSTTYSLVKDNSAGGTGTLNVDVSGFTGTTNRIYWVTIASSTTFNWGTSYANGTNIGTGVTITGAFQTLDNGVQIKLSAGGHVAGDRWAFRAFPTPKFVIGKSTTGNAPFDLLGNGLITGSLEITGSLVVTGSIIATNGITGAIAATNGVVSGSSQVVGILSSLNTYTGSNDTTNTTQNNRLTNLETTSASVNISVSNLNTYSASVSNSIQQLNLFTSSTAALGSLNSFTSSATIRLNNLETTTASLNISVTNLNSYSTSVSNSIQQLSTFTSSANARLTNLESTTASLNISVNSLNTYSASVSNSIQQLNLFTSSTAALGSLNAFTASSAIRLTNLESTTASLNISVTNLNSYSASVSNSILYVNTVTASLNTFTASASSRLTNLETTSASVNISVTNINTFTASNAIASLNTYTGSISDPKFVQIGASTSSLNNFTSSLLTALTASGTNLTANGNLTVQGNLIISGTTTTINSQTLNIGDNIIELNYGGTATKSGIYTKDATGGSLISGSFLWDATNDYWIAGISGSESRVLVVGSMGVVSGSTQISIAGTSDYTSLFTGIASATSSLNSFTSSAAPRLTNLETTTASLNISVTNLNSYSASVSNSIGAINAFSSSENTKASTLATYTGSVDTKFTLVAASTSSLNSFTSSTAPRLTNLETTSASVNISVSNINSYTASVSNSIQQLSSKTGSYATTGSNSFNGNQIITGSLTVTSLTTIATSLTTNSSSFVLTSGSNLIIQNAGLAEITGSLRVSGSTTITGSVSVTGSVTATSFTGSLFGTASFALNGSSNAILYQTASAASTWVFNHFLATPYPVVTVYDNNNSVIIPQSITANDSSSLTITFSSARTGVAVASKGGYVGSAVGTATTANALTTARLINGTSFDGTQNITIPNLVSGSSQISLAGTSDYSSLFGGIASATSSLNIFTSSAALRLTNLETATGSNTVVSQSIFFINNYTGSAAISQSVVNNRLTALEIASSSLEFFTSSQITKNSTLATYTSSIDIKFATLGIVSSSLNQFTASINGWSGSVATTGSNSFGGNQTITGSLTVTGTITANQYNVSIVSSSVLYTSGSTKFGNTSDDIMSVTGSLQVTGSLTVNGPTTLSGSLSLSPSQSAFLVSHSISQSTTVGATVYGVNITPLFTNVTSSQTQTALRVMPTFTGSFSGSNTANIIADFGATSVGSQFTITDVVSGSIYMVNDISGLPIIEALSDGQVNMYDFPYKVFNKSGSYLSLGTSLTPSSSVTVQSDFIINKGYGLYSRTTQVSGSTVSNVTSSLFNLVFSNVSSSVFMSAVVTGYDTGSRQTVTGDIKSTIKYNAGVASVVGYNQKFLNSEVANVNFDIAASSTSASLLVYGSGSTTYKWGATITYQVI